MHTTFDGKPNYSGCLFIQNSQNPDFSDGNTVIYGHNMLNGSMFGGLKRLANDKNNLKTPYFDLYLRNGTRNRYRIIAIHVTNKNSSMYHVPDGPKNRQDYVQKCIWYGGTQNQFPWTEEEKQAITNGNPVVTLSTCYGVQGTPKRTLVQGILIDWEKK